MKNTKRIIKNNHGITLIALVVTIIILLILAGISISLIAGGEGILKKAELAVDTTNIESAKEQVLLKIAEEQAEYYEKRYVDGTVNENTEFGDWIYTKYAGEKVSTTDYEFTITLPNGVSSVEESNSYLITVNKKDTSETIATGVLNKAGDLQWNSDISDNGDDTGDEEIDEEFLKYKKKIAQTITELGIPTSYTQKADEYIEHIKILADKNYEEGKESDIVLLKSDLNSRYVQTISLANIEGYENFDAEDFIIVNKNMLCSNRNDGESISTMSKTYDKQTGTLTLGKQKSFASKYKWTFWNTYDLYAIKRKPQQVNINNTSNNGKEDLQEFKDKLAQTIEKYGIENEEGNLIVDKTEEEVSEYIKRIAKNKFEEGVATYKVLIQAELSSRYNQQVSLSNIEDYQNLTMDDFLIVNKNITWTEQNDRVEISTMSKSYNPSTGTLDFGVQKSYSDVWTFWNIYDVYLLKKEVINLEEYTE